MLRLERLLRCKALVTGLALTLTCVPHLSTTASHGRGMNGDLLALGNAASQALAKIFASPAIRRSSPLSALLVASPVALVLALLSALVFQSPLTSSSLAWGVLAGLVGGAGLVLNFRALLYGPVAVVIPVMTGASTALLVGASWVAEGRPAVGTLVGAVLCLGAVAVISWGNKDERQQQHTPQTVAYALGAGVCFAGFGVIIRHGSQESSLWAVVGTRVGVLALVLVLALVRRVKVPTARTAKIQASLSGVFDAAANILFVEALVFTTLAVVSVVATLTPLIAAVLAFFFLGQRLARHQIAGLAIAVIGVWLVILQ